MAQKKKTPAKAKRSKPKKIQLSPVQKALRKLPSATKEFEKVLKGESGYTRI